MRINVIACLAALLAVASPARAEPKEADRILSEATLDIDKDGKSDRALLIERENGTDLRIYLDAGEGAVDMKKPPTFEKKNAAFYAYGSTSIPQLEAKGSSLVVITGKDRSRYQWSERLTIAHRNGAFLVVGLAHSEDDVDEEKSLGSCDVNFLTGKGKRNGRAFRTKFPARRLADWREDDMPKECKF